MQSEKSPFAGVKTFFIVYFALLVLVLSAIGILGLAGLELINPGMKYLLFGILLVSALIAGAWWVVCKMWRRWLKLAAGLGFAALILLVILVLYVVSSFMMVMFVPMHYTTLSSPSGKAAVVMRSAQLHPESTPDDAVLIYSYSVHPRKLHFFYEKQSQNEGEVRILSNSGAQLMYEWESDDRLRLFLENAEAGDGGELFLENAEAGDGGELFYSAK